MKRKLVILVPFSCKDKTGGSSIRICGYTESLNNYIDNFVFLSTVRPNYIEAKHFKSYTIHRRWNKVLLLHNLLFQRYAWLSKLLSRIIECFSGIQKLDSFITADTLIWAHLEQTVALYLRFTRGITILYDVHGIFDIQREYRLGLSVYRKWWFDRNCQHEVVLLKNSDYINVVSAEMKEFILTRFNPQGRILIAPDGIPISLSYYKEIQPADLQAYRHDSKKIALFAGSFKPIGGVMELLKEFTDNKDLTNRFVLIMIGAGPSQKSMQHLLTQYPQAKVIIIPPMPHGDLIGYMKAADVVICPDQIENTYNQITPHIKLYDAVASGTPVVATDIKVNKNLFPEGERVMYYNYGDGSFREALIKALNLSHEIDDNIEYLTYVARLQQYVDSYREILNI